MPKIILFLLVKSTFVTESTPAMFTPQIFNIFHQIFIYKKNTIKFKKYLKIDILIKTYKRYLFIC